MVGFAVFTKTEHKARTLMLYIYSDSDDIVWKMVHFYSNGQNKSTLELLELKHRRTILTEHIKNYKSLNHFGKKTQGI